MICQVTYVDDAWRAFELVSLSSTPACKNLTIILGSLVGIRCNWGKFKFIPNILETHMVLGSARFATYQNECIHCIISSK
jgi:hypothetical protein